MKADFLSVLIWVKTVCKGYEKTTKIAVHKERVNFSHFPFGNLVCPDLGLKCFPRLLAYDKICH